MNKQQDRRRRADLQIKRNTIRGLTRPELSSVQGGIEECSTTKTVKTAFCDPPPP
jgi:hypothetical protein